MLTENFAVEVWPDYVPPPKELLKEKTENADALITMLNDKLDRSLFDIASKLKIIAQAAVSFDNINLQEATKRGVYATNMPDVLIETTADFAWMLLTAVAWRLVEANRYVRSGQWAVA